MKTKQTFLCDFEKLIEYSASAINVVSSNLSVGLFPRSKTFFLIINAQVSSYQLQK